MNLVCAIATPAAQSMANATHDIPIVGTAITDYVGAKLAASNEKPGGNVTGTSDMSPIKEQIDLMLKICPTVKTIGVIYCSSEVNSEVQAKAIAEDAESRGLKGRTATSYKLGMQSGEMAADILEGKKKPADMPIEMAKELKVSINKKNAETLGIEIPADILKDAQIFE